MEWFRFFFVVAVVVVVYFEGSEPRPKYLYISCCKQYCVCVVDEDLIFSMNPLKDIRICCNFIISSLIFTTFLFSNLNKYNKVKRCRLIVRHVQTLRRHHPPRVVFLHMHGDGWCVCMCINDILIQNYIALLLLTPQNIYIFI